MHLTDDEVLAEIERMITGYRAVARTPGVPGHKSYLALKAAATEIRARMPHRIGETARELDRALTDLERSHNPGIPGPAGFGFGAQHHLAMQVRSRWPIIRQALAAFEGKAVAS